MPIARPAAAAPLMAALVAGAAPGAALELGLPIACEPGRDCWIPRYVDLDPGPGFKDFMCGDLGADGHSGTDFAIPGLAAMRDGVPVLAAAAGKVRNTRDGMEDVSVEAIGMAAIEGRNCGNGVVVMHGDGWETQYCHLRQGSVAVRPGEEVEAGRQLGLVGMSGEASFPHVHLSVRQGDAQVDPFRGTGGGPACGLGEDPLWIDPPAYAPLLLTGSGLAGTPPAWEEVQDGRHAGPTLPEGSPVLVLWVEGFALRAGDRLDYRITAPDGSAFFSDSRTEAKGQARFFRYAGRKRPAAGWPTGTWHGEVTLSREGEQPVSLRREIELR
jgi:hypothetical protein